MTALVGAEAMRAPWVLAFVLAWTLLACVGLWGLLAHLAYLFRGRLVHKPLAVLYALIGLGFAAATLNEAPRAVVENGLGVVVRYDNPIQGAALLALLLLLVVPQIGGCIAYGTLYFRVRDARPRYRIALIAGSLVAWLGLSLGAAILGIATSDSWLVVERALAILVAIAVVLAYNPPALLRATLFQDAGANLELFASRRRLAQRVRDLV